MTNCTISGNVVAGGAAGGHLAALDVGAGLANGHPHRQGAKTALRGVFADAEPGAGVGGAVVAVVAVGAVDPDILVAQLEVGVAVAVDGGEKRILVQRLDGTHREGFAFTAGLVYEI